MRRRDFVTLLGGSAIAWPLAVHAQQRAMPVIGYLGIWSAESDASRLTGLRRGLNETGYVEGRNLTIEYRWHGNQPDRLPTLVAELIQMRVAVIVTPGHLSTLAAKAATTTIPIVFSVGADPVQQVLSQVSIDLAATSRAKISSTSSWPPRGSRYCTSWCPAPRQLAFLGTRPIR